MFNPKATNEPTLTDVFDLLLDIDSTLEEIFHFIQREETEGWDHFCEDDDEQQDMDVPGMLAAVAIIDHEHRLSEIEAMLEKA